MNARYERENFEAWWKDNAWEEGTPYGEWSPNRNASGEYRSIEANIAWAAWQAAVKSTE